MIALRAVQTIDFMTAKWAHLPYELLETVSNRIINEISGISRVAYDISGSLPATISGNEGLVELRIFTDFCSYKLATQLTQLFAFLGDVSSTVKNHVCSLCIPHKRGW